MTFSELFPFESELNLEYLVNTFDVKDKKSSSCTIID
jgi:hypothetical protein